MKYEVAITETLRMLVITDANSKFEAEQTVSEEWKDGKYVLDSENFCNVDFNAGRCDDES